MGGAGWGPGPCKGKKQPGTSKLLICDLLQVNHSPIDCLDGLVLSALSKLIQWGIARFAQKIRYDFSNEIGFFD